MKSTKEQVFANIFFKLIIDKYEKQNGFLYKPKEEQTVSVEIKQKKGKIIIDFYSDCGKHGMVEPLSGFILTPERLMKILGEYEDITEDEV